MTAPGIDPTAAIRRTAAAALTLVAVVAAAPPDARAAFVPSLDITLESAAPGAVPSVAGWVTQSELETPLSRLTFRFPSGFTPNQAYSGAVCGAAARTARSCPAESRVGTLFLSLPGEAPERGGIHLAEPVPSLVSYVGDRVLDGRVAVRSSGAIDLTFDRLPPLPGATVGVLLDGGAKGLFRNPAACGTRTLQGRFTSHAGELAIVERPYLPSGCPDVIRISRASVRPSRFRLPGPGTVFSFRTSEPAGPSNVYVQVFRRGHWKRIGGIIADVVAGRNRVNFDGRLDGRLLGPGRYRFVLLPRGSAQTKTAEFTVLPRRR